MSDESEAYKIATEAGREAVKQLLVVTGGLLAGYLAFTGRSETADILDKSWARFVISLLFCSLFLGTLSLAMSYLMHAARSRYIQDRKESDRQWEIIWERSSIAVTVAAFVFFLVAIATIVATAYC